MKFTKINVFKAKIRYSLHSHLFGGYILHKARSHVLVLNKEQDAHGCYSILHLEHHTNYSDYGITIIHNSYLNTPDKWLEFTLEIPNSMIFDTSVIVDSGIKKRRKKKNFIKRNIKLR
jgi:hypothetical protein